MPPASRSRATPAAVPLRRLASTHGGSVSPGTGPAVQRAAVIPATPTGSAVPLLSAADKSGSGSGTAPPTGAPMAIPQMPSRPSAFTAPAVVQRYAPAAPRAPKAPGSTPGNTSTNATTRAPAPVPVQRDADGPLRPTAATTTTAVSAVSAHGTSSRGPSAAAPTGGAPPKKDPGDLPPDYLAVAKGQFDPRSLTDFQLDELTHRLIGRITRLIRTELRLDRERIGRLRDPRR
ncbi:extensin [Streptomyces sp. NPDC050704]|uniref:extensin n=1 Tax=Streptomyces sp. NPDC050704 TaxID=3157219 RepID=UPI0034323ECA